MRHRQPPHLSFALPLLALLPSSEPGGRHKHPPKATHEAQGHTPAADALAPDAPIVTTRLQKARLRLHLLQLQRQERRNATTELSPSPSPSSSPSPSPAPSSHQPATTHARPIFPCYMQNPFASASSKPPSGKTQQPTEPDKPNGSYTAEERRARSERLRSRWRDPEWRAAILAKRRSKDSMRRKSESMKELWQDDAWRSKMRDSRLGRPAPNKGVAASAETRLRMSLSRKGFTHTPESRSKMSQAKRNRPPGDEWRRLISESKKGKTKEYFAMRREFRALHRDLKLWSDSYRAKHGRLPSAMTYERFVAPIMVLRIRRYLMLRETLGQEDVDLRDDIMA